MIALFVAFALAAPREEVRVATPDGAEIGFTHLANPGHRAVILCHGISSNHHFWDLSPGRSLADALHADGWDVWNLDLRGHGIVERTSAGRRPSTRTNLDTYGMIDVPTAIAYVRATTGQEEVAWVGHSMGGMVLAIHLARAGDAGLSTAVVVASPLDFRDPDPLVTAAFRLAPLGPARLPTPLGGRVLAALGRHAPLSADEMLFNPEIVAPEARRAQLEAVVSPMMRGEVRQLGRVRHGELVGDDGLVYRDALGAIDLPMYFLAGRADRIAPPDRVRGYFDAVGSADRRFEVASRADGWRGDYGHLDFGCSDLAATEVFPRIAAWLDAHAGGTDAPTDR